MLKPASTTCNFDNCHGILQQCDGATPSTVTCRLLAELLSENEFFERFRKRCNWSHAYNYVYCFAVVFYPCKYPVITRTQTLGLVVVHDLWGTCVSDVGYPIDAAFLLLFLLLFVCFGTDRIAYLTPRRFAEAGLVHTFWGRHITSHHRCSWWGRTKFLTHLCDLM